jgi:hypothetical protein
MLGEITDLIMSLYPMAEYGSCNNHQQQQWCVMNLVVTTYISMLLPVSASITGELLGSLYFGQENGAKHANSHEVLMCLLQAFIPSYMVM